jgi:archaetidylinositol phosphate synthase
LLLCGYAQLKAVDRIQLNLLAKSERRLLNWLCPRLPAWISPDLLTATGFSGSVISATGYYLSNHNASWLWLAVAGYFINWFGDSLDGSIARYRKIERPKFGYFVDHSTDAFANMILVIGIGSSPYVRLDVALLGLVGYLLMSIHTFLGAQVLGEFRLTYLNGGPTELRMVLIAMTLAMLAVGTDRLSGFSFSVFDTFIALLASVMIALYLVQTARTARALNKLKE